jgi:2-ketocyclohexanecarboxyl-CoA hydrolase
MLEWGLVNAVVPMEKLDEEVAKWCQEILAMSPTCLKTVKASFRHHMNPVMDQDMHAVLRQVAPGYFQTGEQQEGATAFLEKRKPDFGRWRT